MFKAFLMMDTRPKTAVLHQFAGIGDLVWMIPYFRAAAEKSRDGKVAVIANPRTFARDLLSHEPWVSEVIDFDHPPKTARSRKGRHTGFWGMLRMARELRRRRFDRIYLFAGRPNRALIAFLAGIPERYGFGHHLLQRPFLNKKPYVKPYKGPAVNIYKNAVSFALLHGLVDHEIVPRISVPDALVEEMRKRFAELPRPLYALGIGGSQSFKQWGSANYRELAEKLTGMGFGVLLLGGPDEKVMAGDLRAGLPENLRSRVGILTDASVLGSAAALKMCDACIGNDTGSVQLSAACATPTYVLLGPRPLLDHDPDIKMLKAPTLEAITPEDVLTKLKADKAPGF